jgi:hypothetical protein
MNKPEIPPFLVRLSLNIDADARAIRRAYARELKLIDQESDAAGFQSLREHYEAALQWLAYQEWEREHGDDDESDADTAAPAPTVSLVKPDAQAVPPSPGATVFQRLTEACRQLLAQPEGATLPAWEQAIASHLADQELFAIGARTAFEQAIVEWLGEGWAPGKEKLFAAATDVFDWANDRRRLQQFGYAGMIVNQAIDERAIFLRQDGGDIDIHRTIIARLREQSTPDSRQLKYDMPFLEQLLARFPHLMALTVSEAAVAHWREQFVQQGGVITPVQILATKPQSSNWSWGWGIFGFIMLLRMCGSMSSSHPPPVAAPQYEAVVPSAVSFGPASVDLTDADVHFVLPKGTLPGTYSVTQLVTFDGLGNPLTVSPKQKSPYAELDHAVMRAIIRTGPYPQYGGSSVMFNYTLTVK